MPYPEETISWLTSPDRVKNQILDDMASIQNIPADSLNRVRQELTTRLNNNWTEFTRFAALSAAVHAIGRPHVFVGYGVASIPRVLVPGANKSRMRHIEDTLCVFRYSRSLSASLGTQHKIETQLGRVSLDIQPEHLNMLNKYSADKDSGYHAITAEAGCMTWSDPNELALCAFLYRCLAEDIPLDSTIVDMQRFVQWNGAPYSEIYLKRSALLAVSQDGSIVVAKHGPLGASRRFLLTPVGPLPLPAPKNNRAGGKDLLSHQETWLNSGKSGLLKFLKSAGIHPSHGEAWGPETMAALARAQLCQTFERDRD